VSENETSLIKLTITLIFDCIENGRLVFTQQQEQQKTGLEKDSCFGQHADVWSKPKKMKLIEAKADNRGKKEKTELLKYIVGP